ncbi:MAG TPA: YkuS family protein [Bacillaceae bacterium]
MAKIGVEESLTNVHQALKEKGYDVITIRNEADARNCDCCVVTGIDSNMMGIQTVTMEGSVIEASGMTADEVCEAVESRFQ